MYTYVPVGSEARSGWIKTTWSADLQKGESRDTCLAYNRPTSREIFALEAGIITAKPLKESMSLMSH